MCVLEAIFWRLLMLVAAAFGFCLERNMKKLQRKKTDCLCRFCFMCVYVVCACKSEECVCSVCARERV